MELRKITDAASADYALADKVNNEAFPPEELMPSSRQLELCRRGELDFMAVYDEGEFVGFTTVRPGFGLAYVFFLAVSPDTRSKGYGTRILDLLRETYPALQVVLDIEPEDPSAPNAGMRTRRRNFYLRNGFRSSGKLLCYSGLRFEIMYSADKEFHLENYRRMMDSIAAMVREHFEPGFKSEIISMG